MADQQGKTLGLEYVAGLICGEGTFCLGVHRIKARKGSLRIIPIFEIFMCDEQTILQAAEILRNHDLPVYLQRRDKATRKLHVGIHAAGIKRVKRYCDTFIPYLTGTKKEAAILVLEFCEIRLSTPLRGPVKIPYTDRELQIVRELREVNGNPNGKKNPLD